MFSKVEMQSDAFSEKSVGEKRQSPTRITMKTALLGILLLSLIAILILQTVYLMKVAHRLTIVEEATWLDTQPMGTETMSLDELQSNKSTNRNRRSVTVRNYQLRHSSMNTPNLSSAHLVANVETSVAPGAYISWLSNSPGFRHNDFRNQSNRFIKVSSSGYYYVYAQLNIVANNSKHSAQRYGFQVTRHYSHNTEGVNVPLGEEAIPLLSVNSVLFPIYNGMDSLETKYTGGTFLLCKNQAVGVRASPYFRPMGLDLIAGGTDMQSLSFLGLLQTKKLDARLEGRYCRRPSTI